MPRLWRSFGSALALSIGVVLVAVTSVPGAHAATALVMGGTGQPDPKQVPGYLDAVGRLYLNQAAACAVATCQVHATVTPEEFSPFFTGGMRFGDSVATGLGMLDTDVRRYLGQNGEPLVVFGNSQSATVATEEKRRLAADPTVAADSLQFVLVGNPNRPNGGFLQRFHPITIPVVDYLPTTSPADTGGPVTTDISFQYDIASDFPTYPLNALAMLNTLIGIGIHGSYTTTHDGYSESELLAEINDPHNRQIVGNTTYVTIPTRVLPLAQAIRDTGHTLGLSAFTTPVADLVEPTLRVLVELGYHRTVGYGAQNSFGLIPAANPVTVVGDLITAAGEGINNVVRRGTSRPAPPPVAARVPTSSPERPAAQRDLATEQVATPPAAQATTETAHRSEDTPDTNGTRDTKRQPATTQSHPDATPPGSPGDPSERRRQDQSARDDVQPGRAGATADTPDGSDSRPAHASGPSDQGASADAA
ncbi:PE-PPE domain-containing protein [Mycobacterium hodleri]|uniref:PE-PPE domain-containing protein n=1 Tax=Mycolicibacterium hodleri TaxID=49897 RepID=A0A544VTE4_9MYCO|nr:PE-PPE domain-containing protein [Mycolicibacterium hodleri]TQR83256.1 PE-PPE domain-containing protein [Mycolicibacterium hodleri]